MKRFIKNNLFGFILGIILASSVGVIAYSINASDIGFTSSNESFTATNVQEAMDQLYNQSSKSELTLLGKNSTTVLNMSDYKYIIFLKNYDGSIFSGDIIGSFSKGHSSVHPNNAFFIIPYEEFKLGNTYTLYSEDYNALKSMTIKYVNDTTISLSGTVNNYFIYGI